jgi:hypothetical protein
MQGWRRPYTRLGKPEYRPRLMNLDGHVIISTFGAEYRGFVQYYLLAGDVWRLHRLHWGMLTSMLKTVAAKHRSTVTKMARRYQATIDTPHPLVARIGGISLRRQRRGSSTIAN